MTTTNTTGIDINAGNTAFPSTSTSAAAGSSGGSGSGSFWNWLGDREWDSILGNVVKGTGSWAAAQDMLDRLGNIGQGVASGMADIGSQAKTDTTFQPFTVKAGGTDPSSITTTSTGGFTTTLGDKEKQQVTDLQTALSGMLTNFNASDRGVREGTIYDRIRAIQNPEEARQQQLLSDRLLSQGRAGLSTAMYGGSPEQFAMDKARAEAMNQAALMAMDQAGKERGQDIANIQSLMGLQYVPDTQALNMLGAGTNLASIADLGRRQGAGLFAEASSAGLEALMNTELGRANFLQGLYGSAIGSGGAGGSGGDGWFNQVIDSIFDW